MRRLERVDFLKRIHYTNNKMFIVKIRNKSTLIPCFFFFYFTPYLIFYRGKTKKKTRQTQQQLIVIYIRVQTNAQ